MILIKIIGIILVFGSSIAVGISAKTEMFLRVKALQQMILVVEIIERELKFNMIKISDLIFKLSKEIQNPIGRVFKKMYKLVTISDGLSIEYKWTKTFMEYGEFLHLKKSDLDIIKNMSNILGKYDVDEQLKSILYYKKLLNENLVDAKLKLKKEGNITNTIAISVGLLIVIILI